MIIRNIIILTEFPTNPSSFLSLSALIQIWAFRLWIVPEDSAAAEGRLPGAVEEGAHSGCAPLVSCSF